MDVEGTPRGEGVRCAREAPDDVAGLRVDRVGRAVRGAAGDALGNGGAVGREFLLDERISTQCVYELRGVDVVARIFVH